MKMMAARLHGKGDLRLEEAPLRPIREDEVLAEVVSDSLCMSSYKAAMQGPAHKRVPKDIDKNPIVIGHEFAGVILEVGEKHRDRFRPGQRFTVQPNTNHPLGYGPGYSYGDFGGDATHAIIPGFIIEKDCLLTYESEGYFKASLAEPISCLVSALNASYHLGDDGKTHVMGIRNGGRFVSLAGCGPMGLGLIDLVLNGEKRPSRLVVADIDPTRLERAGRLFPPAMASEKGIELSFVDTRDLDDPVASLIGESGGDGYDDVFVLAPVAAVVETGDALLRRDGCLNFFAGPQETGFAAKLNFYNIHYKETHVVGTSGGNAKDMKDALAFIESGRIDPAVLITHVGGLDAAAEATLNLPAIPGGKKLIYTNIALPLTAIDDFGARGKNDPLFAGLDEICRRRGGLWSMEAERLLLEKGNRILQPLNGGGHVDQP
jgi:threonine dehydrogenase-like Zn-dependent dehydrogenase